MKYLLIYFILNQSSIINLLLGKQISKLLLLRALFLSQNICLFWGLGFFFLVFLSLFFL